MKELDNIKIPYNIDLLTENAIKKGEKFNERKIKRGKKFIIAASVCCILTLTLSSLVVIANEIPVVKDIFEEFRYDLGLRGMNKGSTLNETVTKNGVSITIQDIICDEYGIYASFIVKSDEAFKNDLNDTQLMIYDNEVNTKFHKSNLDVGGVAGIEGKFIDENTFVGVKPYLFKEDVEIPDEFNIDINIDAVSLNSIKDNSLINGKWKFSVPVKLNSEGVKIIEPNITENDISINKITLSKFNGFIELEIPSKLQGKYVDIVTDLGQTIDIISIGEVDANLYKIRTKGVPEEATKLIFKFSDKYSIEIDI